MSGHAESEEKREFRCDHCNGRILVPKSLPATTGPCPHCGGSITSPAPEAPTAAPPIPTVRVEIPAMGEREVPVVAPPAEPRAAEPAAEARREDLENAGTAAEAAGKAADQPHAAAETPSQPAAAEQKISPAAIAPREEVPRLTPEPKPTLTEARMIDLPLHGEGDQHRENRKVEPRRSPVIPLVVLSILILAAAGTWYQVSKTLTTPSDVKAPPAIDPTLQAQLRDKEYNESGWRTEAVQVLKEFLAADSTAGKAAFSLRGGDLLMEMDQFYGPGKIDDSDTPVDAFAFDDLSEDDRRRGIFLMKFDQPPHLRLRDFFRPLATMEVREGLEQPDLLLSAFAAVENFATEPVRASAFFKRTPDGLKLDWPVFIQTKHRLFREFVEVPVPGESKVFRLIIMEDVPEQGRDRMGVKTYRMRDPAHLGDSARVGVLVDSEIGSALSAVNWRGIKGAVQKARTVTLELEWSDEPVPELGVKRFICWEFLGLGTEVTADMER